MISKEDVQHIAKLARLELTQQETEQMQKDMSAILDYFDLLKKAPKPKTAAKTTKAKANVLRTDKAMDRVAGLAGDLVNAAPDKKEGYFKVKAIFND